MQNISSNNNLKVFDAFVSSVCEIEHSDYGSFFFINTTKENISKLEDLGINVDVIPVDMFFNTTKENSSYIYDFLGIIKISGNKFKDYKFMANLFKTECTGLLLAANIKSDSIASVFVNSDFSVSLKTEFVVCNN